MSPLDRLVLFLMVSCVCAVGVGIISHTGYWLITGEFYQDWWQFPLVFGCAIGAASLPQD